jgi:magnesium transporter
MPIRSRDHHAVSGFVDPGPERLPENTSPLIHGRVPASVPASARQDLGRRGAPMNASPQSIPATTARKDFYFLSEFLGRTIRHVDGRCLGRVADIIVEKVEPYPVVTGLMIRRGVRGPRAFLPWSAVSTIDPQLTADLDALHLAEAPETGGKRAFLREEVLDKQIVDTSGAKVVRVNDLQFLRLNSQLRLVHVDVGFRGLMRRVGWEKWMSAAFQWMFAYDMPDHFIAWKYVHLLSGSSPLALSVARKGLAQLHPAELADILEDLSGRDRSVIFHALDTETAADALEEIDDPRLQKALIETVSVEKASDIIEEMSPSDAVDLLADLPRETADEILEEMEDQRAEDLRELLVHPEETAGGMMTTAYLSQPPDATAVSALQTLKERSEDLDVIDYVYIVDMNNVLLGVVSIRDLLTASPLRRLSEIYSARLVTVAPEAGKDEAVELLAKYGFKALPVVDDQGGLNGVISFRSALAVLAPEPG